MDNEKLSTFWNLVWETFSWQLNNCRDGSLFLTLSLFLLSRGRKEEKEMLGGKEITWANNIGGIFEVDGGGRE